MRLLHDHLITAIAAAGVIMTTTGLLHDRATDTTQQVQVHSAQHALASFAEVVEQDVRSIGSGVPTGSPMILTVEEDEFRFLGTADSTDEARMIVYERTELAPGLNGAPRYQMTRWVDGVAKGQSPVLTDAEIEVYDAAGNVLGAGALSSARRVRLRLEVETPLGGEAAEDAPHRRVAWETEIAPANLARRQTSTAAHPLLQASVTLSTLGS